MQIQTNKQVHPIIPSEFLVIRSTSSYFSATIPPLRSSMAPSQQSKTCVGVDVAADNTSCDALSFAGLVCVEDQKPKNHPKNVKQSDRQDQSFEFSRSAIDSLALRSNNNCLSELIIPKLQPLQQQSQSQPRVKQGKDISHRSSTPATQNGETVDDVRGSFKPDCNKIRKQAVKSSAPSSKLGCKMFQSFLSPCRECQAVKPDVKAPIVQRENYKSRC